MQLAEARTDPISFCEYVGRDIDPDFELADVHRSWLEMWWREQESVTHSSIGLGKSTLARMFVSFLLGSDPEERVIWVGATQKQPRSSLGAMAAMIESPGYRARIHHVFPQLRPGRIWRSTEIDVARLGPTGDKDPSISVYGAFADSVLGSRATTVVFDDLCTWANTLTADGRQKMIEWLSTVIARLTKRKCRIMALGNFWHGQDALIDMVNTRGFKYRKDPAYRLGPDGERIPTAPTVLDLGKIKRLERQLGARQSQKMLLCEGGANDDGRFKSAWFAAALEAGRGQPFRPPRADGSCFTGVDFGYTKKGTSALTAMVTCRVLNDGRRLVIDVRSGRWDTREIRQNLSDVYHRYHPIIGVESNGAQGMAAELMGEAIAIPLVEKNTGIDKWHLVHGIEGLANELSEGYWVFPCEPHPVLDASSGYVEPDGPSDAKAGHPHPEVQELINEALLHQPGKHDGDRLMAWWICAKTLRDSATGALMGQQMMVEGPAFDLLAR